jgi:hypothetical protein
MEWSVDDAKALMRRILGEYREMPGLALTVAQAARLWHLDQGRSQTLLDALVGDGRLRRTPHGAYVTAQQGR